MERGNFFSWTVINDETIVKKSDKSFFAYNESGVPKEIKWFFEAEEMQYGEHKEIKFRHMNFDYAGKIEFDPMQRCRISWHSDLGEIFKKYSCNGFPLVRFHKVSLDTYEVEIIENNSEDEEIEEPYVTIISRKEGRKKEVYVTKYERNSVNRKNAIKIHGTKCMVCGFDFEQVYGEAGRNIIDVHHVNPLAEVDEEVVVNPETDLVCVCPNCHRIIHSSRDKIYTVDEVRKMLMR